MDGHHLSFPSNLPIYKQIQPGGQMKKLKWMIVTLLILFVIVPGCGMHYFKLVKHPETGDTKECRADNFGCELFKMQMVDKCVESYERLGYKEVKWKIKWIIGEFLKSLLSKLAFLKNGNLDSKKRLKDPLPNPTV
jgi:hypothetical protein